MTRRAFRREDHVVTKRQMSRDPGLSRKNHAIANVRTAGESDLRAQQRILADGTRVTDLDQIVELRTAPNAALTN